MELSVNERIVKLIEELEEGNQSRFCEKTGIPKSTLSTIIGERRTEPSYKVIRKIVYNYDNVNLKWLILGEGEMLLSSDQPANHPYVKKLQREYEAYKIFTDKKLEAQQAEIHFLKEKLNNELPGNLGLENGK